MSAITDTDVDCFGRWSGGNSYSNYTVITIFQNEGKPYLRRANPMSTTILESPIKWLSNDIFRASIPLWTLVCDTEVEGTFTKDEEVLLTVVFKNDGLTGQETNIVKLRRNNKDCQKYESAILPDFHPPLSTGIFPPGSASDIKLSPPDLSTQLSNLFAPNPKHPELRTDGILILKDGKLVAESYQWGMDAHSLHQVASVTKSIVAIVCGIAMDQGHFTLESVISDAFPDLRAQTQWGDNPPIRIKHALSMTSGTRFGDVETLAAMKSASVEEVVLGAQRLQNPGQRFRYDNGLSMLLAVYVERKTGVSFERFAEELLFEPLRVRNYRWTRLKQASVDGKEQLVLTSGGLEMTVPDMAKIGQLMLNDGLYEGKRILSERWVRLSVEQHTPGGYYPFGYGWHLNKGFRHFGRWDDAYMALGAGENIICVVPSQRVVIVAVSSSWLFPSLTPPILDTVINTLLKELY